MAKKELDVTKITLTYEDGSQREISKGFIGGVSYNELDNTDTITFNLVHIAGNELKLIITAILEMAYKLGMFTGTGDDENDES